MSKIVKIEKNSPHNWHYFKNDMTKFSQIIQHCYINPKIFVDEDGTVTFNKHGEQFYSLLDLLI